MWKNIDKTNSYLSFSETFEYTIYVTNFMKMWNISFSRQLFLECLKDSNKKLEMDEDIMLDRAKNILLNPDNIKSAVIQEEQDLLVVDLCKSFGYAFHIKINLSESSKELFFQKITQPLLNVIDDLHKSEDELRKALLKKDAEIEEYKLEGGELAVYLKTEKFDEESFIRKHSQYKQYFGADFIPSSLLEKRNNVIKLKKEEKAESISYDTQLGNSNRSDSLQVASEMIQENDVDDKKEIQIKIEENRDKTYGKLRRKRKLNL